MKNLENNKLIAEFEGHMINYGFNKEGVLLLGHHISANDLLYDSSWDWLMLVVGKIEGLGYWFDRIRGDVWLKDDNGTVIINNQFHSGGIEAYYKVVVEFIKWYNLHKQ